jgi:NAD(P)H-flavin reductase
VHRVTVQTAWNETARLRGLRVAAGAVAASHTAAGQYVKLRCAAGTAPFALASRPGSDTFELLLKRGAPVADALCELGAGATLEVSEAHGSGYPLDQARGGDLVLVAAGSGIAPIRSAVLEVLARRHDFGRVALYYGERTVDDLAYAREMTSWELAGIHVFRVLSNARGSWVGPMGHVQDVIAASSFDPERTRAFVTGMSEMVVGVRARLVELGLAADRIHGND